MPIRVTQYWNKPPISTIFISNISMSMSVSLYCMGLCPRPCRVPVLVCVHVSMWTCPFSCPCPVHVIFMLKMVMDVDVHMDNDMDRTWNMDTEMNTPSIFMFIFYVIIYHVIIFCIAIFVIISPRTIYTLKKIVCQLETMSQRCGSSLVPFGIFKHLFKLREYKQKSKPF